LKNQSGGAAAPPCHFLLPLTTEHSIRLKPLAGPQHLGEGWPKPAKASVAGSGHPNAMLLRFQNHFFIALR
jgi:hypothetical protein